MRKWMGILIMALSMLLSIGCTASTKDTGDTNTNTTSSSSSGMDTSSSSSGADMSPDMTMAGCTLHSECATGEVCSTSGECITALSGNCDIIISANNSINDIDDNTVILGAIYPRTYAESALIYIEQAIQLGVGEINDSRLPGNRKVAVIGCNSRPEDGDETTCDASSDFAGCDWNNQAQHLIDIGVPAIIGPAFSSVFTDVHKLTGPAGTLTISGSATSPAITNLDEVLGISPGMAWRSIASDKAQSEAIATLIVERNVQTALILVKDDDYGNGLYEEVQIQFADRFQSGDFKAVTYSPEASTSQILETAINNCNSTFDAVVMLTTAEGGDLMVACENTIDNETPAAISRPRYICSEGVKDGSLAALTTDNFSEAEITDIISRFEGTQPITSNTNTSIYNAFVTRFKTFTSTDPGLFASTFYDAVYVTYLAMCTISVDEPITGAGIAEGFASTLIGDELTPGRQSDRAAACAQLQSGTTVNYEGASGPIQFNLNNGDASGSLARWVIEANGGDVTDLTFNDAAGFYNGVDNTWDIPAP